MVALADVGRIVSVLAGAGSVFCQHAVYPVAANKRPDGGIAAKHGVANVCRAVGGLAGLGDVGSGGVVVAPQVSD